MESSVVLLSAVTFGNETSELPVSLQRLFRDKWKIRAKGKEGAAAMFADSRAKVLMWHVDGTKKV